MLIWQIYIANIANAGAAVTYKKHIQRYQMKRKISEGKFLF